MPRSRFLLQVLPFTLLGLAATGVGGWLWPAPATTGAAILRGLLLSLGFVGLLALRRTAPWNLALLLLFGFLAGSFASALSSVGGFRSWWPALAMAGALLALGAQIGRSRRGQWAEVGVGLWLLTWFYLLGWAALLVLDLDPVFHRVWAGFGLALFSGMGAVWFSRCESALDQSPGSALGIDLYLLSLNLVLAARILLFHPFP